MSNYNLDVKEPDRWILHHDTIDASEISAITTWDVQDLLNDGTNYLFGAGFLPSTVLVEKERDFAYLSLFVDRMIYFHLSYCFHLPHSLKVTNNGSPSSGFVYGDGGDELSTALAFHLFARYIHTRSTLQESTV